MHPIYNMNLHKTIKIGIILTILVGTGIFIFAYMTQNSRRSKAAEEISVDFGTIAGEANLQEGSDFDIPVTVSHASNKLSAANLYFYYNSQNLQFLSYGTAPTTIGILQSTSVSTGSDYNMKARIVFVNKKITSQLTSSFVVTLRFKMLKKESTSLSFNGEAAGIVGPSVTGTGVETYNGTKLPLIVTKNITVSGTTSSSSSSSSTDAECAALASGDRSTTQCVIRGGNCKVDPGDVLCSKCPDGYDDLTGAQNLGCATGELCCLPEQTSSSSSSSPASSSSSSLPSTCLRKSVGDANCDGKISPADYSVWLNTQCHHGSLGSCGDTRADFQDPPDSHVDDADYEIWKNNQDPI